MPSSASTSKNAIVGTASVDCHFILELFPFLVKKIGKTPLGSLFSFSVPKTNMGKGFMPFIACPYIEMATAQKFLLYHRGDGAFPSGNLSI